MNEMQRAEDEQINLFDLFRQVGNGWRWIVGGVFAGVLAAIGMIGMTPARYEATALLQTGKIAGVVVEDVSTMVERLKSASFHLEVANHVGDTNWVEQIHGGSGNNVLSAIIPRSSPALVEVKVHAASPDLSLKIAEASTELLIKRQADMSSVVQKKISFDIVVAKERLEASERDLLGLSKTLASTTVRDDRFSQVSLLTSLKLQKETEVFTLRQSVNALEASLLPPATQPARVLEAVFISPRPISPRKGLLLALGSVGGLLAGMVLVFVSSAWRQEKARRRALGQAAS